MALISIIDKVSCENKQNLTEWKGLTRGENKYWSKVLTNLDKWQHGNPRRKCNKLQRKFEESEVLYIGGTHEIEEADGFQKRVNLKKTGNCQLGESIGLYHPENAETLDPTDS